MTNEEAMLYLENALCELDAGIKVYRGTVKEEFIEQRKCFTVALSALQEQAERDKGCEYCKEEESRNASGRTFYKEFPHDARFLTTLDDAHLQVAFDNQSGWVLHFEDDGGDRMFDVKITHCHNCGRRLEAQHDRH